jgi:hypothetical protein
LSIDRKMGRRWGEAHDLSDIGYVHVTKGEIGTALEKYRQALKIFKDIGATREAEKRTNLINILRRQSIYVRRR